MRSPSSGPRASTWWELSLFAPASHLSVELALARGLATPLKAAAVLPSLVRSAEAMGTHGVEEDLTPLARREMSRSASKCEQALESETSWGGLAPDDLVQPHADLAALDAFLNRWTEPSTLQLRVPLLVIQGDADPEVLKPYTDEMVASLRARGGRVDYVVLPGQDHLGALLAGFPKALTWIRSR